MRGARLKQKFAFFLAFTAWTGAWAGPPAREHVVEAHESVPSYVDHDRGFVSAPNDPSLDREPVSASDDLRLQPFQDLAVGDLRSAPGQAVVVDPAQSREGLQGLTLDARHVDKHILGTPEAERNVRQRGEAHVFLDRDRMDAAIRQILEQGEFLGQVRGYDRWGHRFDDIIGYRIDKAGRKVPLYYGEMKVSGDQYHVIPRTRPSQ